MTRDQLKEELAKAYRAIRSFYTAAQKGELPDEVILGYHSPTIGAACRFVRSGKLHGSAFFVGKHFDVLQDALHDHDDAICPGDSGADVLALQADLYALGFGIDKTGVYDEQTRVTVEQFQAALGLVAHGFATRATRDRLSECVRCNQAGH